MTITCNPTSSLVEWLPGMVGATSYDWTCQPPNEFEDGEIIIAAETEIVRQPAAADAQDSILGATSFTDTESKFNLSLAEDQAVGTYTFKHTVTTDLGRVVVQYPSLVVRDHPTITH